MQFRIRQAGDSAWLVELPDRIDPEVNGRAIQIARKVERAGLPVTDLVIGYRTVMVYVDPLARGADTVERRLNEIASEPRGSTEESGSLIEVPVCYGSELGPDLEDVARFGGCSGDEVIRRHLAREYRVYVVGFVPGWAYMASVDATIAAPRRSSPRLKVPAGSVGIAGTQTGIYPTETPGGWNLIGRTPVRPYDPGRATPFLFRPGDRVRFQRVSIEDYRRTSQWGDV
jgi:inhibitor of KinA